MKKFLAVVKHEYRKIVVKWTFIIATLMFPLLAAAFTVVPTLLMTMKGEATRLVIVDQSGKIAARIKENLTPEKIAKKQDRADGQPFGDLNSSRAEKMKRETDAMSGGFVFVDYAAQNKAAEQIKRELTGKIIDDQIDAYLIVPADYNSAEADFDFYSRKAGDFAVNQTLRVALNSAVRSQRLADAKIDETQLENLSGDIDFSVVKIDQKGDEDESGNSKYAAAFVLALMIYLTLLIYGQQILAAVVEEKETRIAEILFSSAKPFELMMGKLVGVGLAGLTQLAIWIGSALILSGLGFANLRLSGSDFSMPEIPPLTVVYFFIFFIIGFFIYATVYALIGAMVTTVQEGGQFAMLPVGLLVLGYVLSLSVIRDPNSSTAFWISIAPFLAPITMPVRIIAETPPFWQIALSAAINIAAISFLIWLAARIYRVGMLMYGKRPTIPEVWKWIRQS